MKVLAIGDPHGDFGRVRRIPLKDLDLILLTGDLGKADLMRRMAFRNIERKEKGLPEIEYSPQQKKRAFMQAYDSTLRIIRHLARYAPVYTIFGNVESSNAETRKYSREIGLRLPFLANALNRMRNVRLINNRVANAGGIRIGGLEYFTDTSWVREFRPSDYKERLAEAKKETNKARRILRWFDGLDVLVCHQPPYGVLDKVTAKFAPKHWRGKHAGSKVILDYIKRQQPKYIFCGHIHEGEGHKRVGGTNVYNLGVSGYKIVEL